jgi:hypothetical protein
MTNQIIDLAKLYEKTFGNKPYQVPALSNEKSEPSDLFNIGQKAQQLQFTAKGSLIKEQLQGIEIMLPVRFYDGSKLLMHLPFTVVKINGKKTIIETPLGERRGTVKEQFNIDDYSISVKGFLIDEDRNFPETQLEQLRSLYETSNAITLDNALTNIFLTDPELKEDEQRRVVIYDFDVAEVQGGRIYVRPFSLTLKSDSIFTLELEEES